MLRRRYNHRDKFLFSIVFNEKFLAMSVTFKSHFMTRSAFAQTKKKLFLVFVGSFEVNEIDSCWSNNAQKGWFGKMREVGRKRERNHRHSGGEGRERD
jgi:hypothetical protein